MSRIYVAALREQLIESLCRDGFDSHVYKTADLMTALSDDGGRTWRLGKGRLAAKDAYGKRVMTQEPGVLELKDGRVIMWARTDRGIRLREGLRPCRYLFRAARRSRIDDLDLAAAFHTTRKRLAIAPDARIFRQKDAIAVDAVVDDHLRPFRLKPAQDLPLVVGRWNRRLPRLEVVLPLSPGVEVEPHLHLDVVMTRNIRCIANLVIDIARSSDKGQPSHYHTNGLFVE